jgi:hypothetical protein
VAPPTDRNDRPILALALALSIACSLLVAGVALVSSAEGMPGGLVPLDAEGVKKELAPPMGELQRLTHKLSLSIGGGNLDLTKFYAYESLELLREIQRDIPQYDGHPVALWIDRLAMPAYDALTKALNAAEDEPTTALRNDVGRAVSGVVDACNACHEATSHAFIRIVDERKRNPFNQEFGK